MRDKSKSDRNRIGFVRSLEYANMPNQFVIGRVFCVTLLSSHAPVGYKSHITFPNLTAYQQLHQIVNNLFKQTVRTGDTPAEHE